jgi:peptide/nickel transport system substrate-binding protein
MPKKGRIAFGSTLLLLVSLLVAGCVSSSPNNGVNQITYRYQTPTSKGGTVLMSDWEFPDSTNPLFNTSAVGMELSNALWGSPYVNTPDGVLLPDELAEIPTVANGDVSADGLNVLMKLNHHLKWSDGQPITADDFVYWWKVNQDPATAAASTSGFDQIASATAQDRYTVALRYKELFAPFLYYLPLAAPSHIWKIVPDSKLQTTPSINLTPAVTSGPYVVQDYASGQSFTLVPNQYYTSTSLHPAHLSKLVFKGYQSKDALIAGYQAGETDHAEDLTLGDLQKLDGLPGLQVTSGAGYEHLDFNMSRPIFQNIDVRKAIWQAIDRCAIIEHLLHQQCSQLLVNTVEPGLPDTNDAIKALPYNLKAAKADMKAAGWNCSSTPCTKNGQPFPTLNLVTTSGNTLRINTVQLIKDDLAQIGIPVNIDGQVFPAGLFFGDFASSGTLATGNYDLAVYGYVLSLDSDANLYTSYHSSQIPSAKDPSGTNYQRLHDPKLDTLLEQGRATLDQQQRTKIYQNVQAYMTQQVYQVPLYERANITLTDASVGNYFPNPTAIGNQWNIGEWWRKGAQ